MNCNFQPSYSVTWFLNSRYFVHFVNFDLEITRISYVIIKSYCHTLNIFYKRQCEFLPRPVSYIFQHFPQPCPLFISYFSSKFGQAPHAKMESIAFKPFKCPLNGPHMGGKVSWYTNWGCLAYFTKCPTIQIASSANSASTASGPRCALSLNFFEKARPCLLFFSTICLPSLIKHNECT